MKIKFILSVIMVLLLLPYVSSSSLQYMVNLELYSDESVALNKITLISGSRGRDFIEGPYLLRVIDARGNTLHRDKFDFIGEVPPFEWFDEQGKQKYAPRRAAKPSAEAYVVQRVTLTIPYFEQADALQIYHPDGRLALYYPLKESCLHGGCLSLIAALKPVQRKSFFSRFFGR